jgi:hypothetical protein
MRLCVVLAVVVLGLTACSSSESTPTGTKTTPPGASFDTLLSNGSIPASGGTLTVNKAGDPLNGLTMTVSSGAYSSALTVTIGSSPNTNLPTANGIVPIAPVVHVNTSVGGYAKGMISFTVPATVPSNTFPVIVLYDSATNTIEPMTTTAYTGTSVTAMTGHLSQPTSLSASGSAARVASRIRKGTNAAQPESLMVSFGVYAIPTAVLMQDWDTHFRPGTNDWEFLALPTEAAPLATFLGTATTELWYFNSRASTTPLNGRFPAIKNAPLSDTIGFHWVSAIDNQVDNYVNSYLSSAYLSLSKKPGGRDSLQFDQIRASFALGALNGGGALPVLVDLQSIALNGYYFLVAYRATGNQIYVADPVSPGDSTLFLQLGTDSMIPYVNPRYKAGVALATPLATPLGLAIPIAPIASSYPDAVAGTVGTTLFPASGFYSWSGQLYDTMYVVDTLRFWAQCAACKYGFASTLSPAPAGNVESSFNIDYIQGGLVTDSISYLGTNGLLITSASIVPGEAVIRGLALGSAPSANATRVPTSLPLWLDWQTITVADLQVTIGPSAPETALNTPLSLQVSVMPNLLPADVSYKWSFSDSTANVTVQNNPNVQHTYTKSGSLVATVQIVDNRNNQVIAQGNTTVLVDGPVELWTIQSFTYLYTLVNGVKMYASDSGVSKDSLAITIQPNTVPTLIALNGPPYPNANYPEPGFGFASPPDSAQQWASVSPIPLAISAPYPPIDVAAYSNTGNATSGTITGQAIQSNANGITNGGFTVNLVKNGSTLSGYIQEQGTGTNSKGVTTTLVIVDSVVAVRAHYP